MIPPNRGNVNGKAGHKPTLEGCIITLDLRPTRRCDRIGLRAPVAQLDRAFASEAKGRLFESSRVHQNLSHDHACLRKKY